MPAAQRQVRRLRRPVAPNVSDDGLLPASVSALVEAWSEFVPSLSGTLRAMKKRPRTSASTALPGVLLGVTVMSPLASVQAVGIVPVTLTFVPRPGVPVTVSSWL